MFIKRVLSIIASFAVLAIASTTLYAESRQERIGRKAHEDLATYTHFYEDKDLNDYVNEVGQKLAANSDEPDIPYKFFIVDSPDINAFALPGGYIYINRGLMTHLSSEAQLAAVLSHEIAHVTRKHGTRRQDQNRLGNVAAFVASVATRNGNVGEAIKLENAVLVSGYGREMELEADEYGASYLYKSGYNPEAIIEVLGILKDHQTFSLRQAKARGRTNGSYHGVFASHPKNDQRLKEVVQQAGLLPPGEGYEGRDTYREKIANAVYGENDNSNTLPGYTRYATKALEVTFVYPQDWVRSTQDQTILLDSGEGTQLQITVTKPSDLTIPAGEQLREAHKVEDLEKEESVYEEPDTQNEAIMALASENEGEKRVAAIYVEEYLYLFESLAPTPISKEADETVKEIIRSFRKADLLDYPTPNIQRVYFHRLKPGETFSELAQNRALGRDTEDHLRLMNGYYPTGEPQPGSWIKMAK